MKAHLTFKKHINNNVVILLPFTMIDYEGKEPKALEEEIKRRLYQNHT